MSAYVSDPEYFTVWSMDLFVIETQFTQPNTDP
jgi:hypothetical protein